MWLSAEPSYAVSVPINQLQNYQTSTPIKLEYITDRSGKLNLQDVMNQVPDTTWKIITTGSVNLGYLTDPIWLHFKVQNPLKERTEEIIELSYPQLDFVDYYMIINGQIKETVHTGDHRPYSSRAIDHPHFLFPIALNQGEQADIYIRVQTNGSLQIPITLWKARDYFVEANKVDQIHALYFGVLLVIVIFNFFVFVALREVTYLYYSFSTLGYLLLFATLRAKTFEVFWPNSPWLQNKMMLIVIPFTVIFAALFSKSFLNLKENSPRINRLLTGIVVVTILAFIGAFVLDYNTSVRLSVMLALLSFIILLSIGPYAWIKGFPSSRYYTIAWGALIFGTLIEALNKYGFLPTNFATVYGMQMGSAFEAILLTLALAERLYQEREEKLTAQAQTLKENKVRRETEQKLIHHALHHPITGLPNRIRFEVLIKEHLDLAKPKRLAVCIIHLMRFQEINKTLGYNNADLLLSEIGLKIDLIAQKLPGILPAENKPINMHQDASMTFACSFEGASFGMILDADIAQASIHVIEATIEDMFKPIDFKHMRLELAPAMGVAISPEHGLNAATLIRHAHVALEAAENNHGKLAYYRAEQDKYNARRLTLMSELKLAIEADQLMLFFQPKYDLKKKSVVAVEALIRWNHHRFGFVPPDEFIPIAEQTGIIHSLTQWVVQHALTLQKTLSKSGFDLNMSINISALDLRNPGFIEFIEENLATNHIEPSSVTFELTETAMMTHPEKSLLMLENLHQIGVRISIDDFGSGYSSLSYIKRLPTDEIKIDKSLVFDLSERLSDQIIIKTTIEMCHAIGFKVVAEGVENQKILDILNNIDCDLIQGYFLSPPLPFEKLIPWLESGKRVSNNQASSA
jgi:EAL domain-containing protein (putative c-di-GMP-specific phosphodiesterase class I)/GGDEF domain-containing protein